MKWGFLSTYPPTQCGLATFTKALVTALDGVPGNESLIVSSTPARSQELPADVAGELIPGDRVSQRRAAELLNSCDVAVIQHEFGIYGGPDGADVLDVIKQVHIPVIVVLHTVLTHPTPGQRRVIDALAATADALVTMTGAARSRLLATHHLLPQQVAVIPHGAVPSQTSVQPVPGRILTWGLLGPGKGIEWGIAALARLRDLDPAPHYLVAGQIHPKVREREGDAYRDHLIATAQRLGVDHMLRFDPTYRATDEMPALIASASVVLLPYDSVDQVTSGVLIEAVAAGRPVVATRFPHAVELLAGGVGMTVPHRNSLAMAGAIRRILTHPETAATLSDAARRAASELYWPAVATRYCELGQRVMADHPQGSVVELRVSAT